MKTKFILHGGFANHHNLENDDFFKEIIKDAPDSSKVLLVYFAKEEGRISSSYEEDVICFEKNKGNKILSFEIADKESFKKQVERADIIYLHGGGTLRLLGTLKEFPNLKELFKGKTIAGESAGAYVLSSCFYSKSEGGVFNGLGLVPVKTICHYAGANGDKLAKCNNGGETLLLEDYKFRVMKSGFSEIS